jgi:hypothetical protein
MGITITYRDPRFEGFSGLSIVGGEEQARATVERLQREGYEVTGTEPPLTLQPVPLNL